MPRTLLGLLTLSMGGISLMSPAMAADYAVPPRQAAEVIYRGPNPYCGPRCGCPVATFVRHRTLVQYYPSSFDPRERDEPRYAYGAMRTYARFAAQSGPPGN